jgi:hypothetical protein
MYTVKNHCNIRYLLSRQGTMETQFDVQGKKQGKASEIEEARQGV